jgi:hypothetical protein
MWLFGDYSLWGLLMSTIDADSKNGVERAKPLFQMKQLRIDKGPRDLLSGARCCGRCTLLAPPDAPIRLLSGESC